MVLLGPAVFMPRVPATGGNSMTGFSVTNRSQSRTQRTLAYGGGDWREWVASMPATRMGQSLCCQLLGQACHTMMCDGVCVSFSRKLQD